MIETERFKGYKKRLEDEQVRVRALIRWAENEMNDRGNVAFPDNYADSGDVDELPDQATDTLFRELDAAFDRRYRDRLGGIEAALQRIQLGTYGRCIICGKEISPDRLDAVPETPYCYEDAREEEALE
ncbi:MAG: TraR/DksA family transcriptional regulator [Bacteroidota bacterium]